MGNEEIIAEIDNGAECGMETYTLSKAEIIILLDKARSEGKEKRNSQCVLKEAQEYIKGKEAGRQSAHNDLKERIGKLKEDLLKSYSTASDEMQAHICCVIETVDEIFPEAKKRRL